MGLGPGFGFLDTGAPCTWKLSPHTERSLPKASAATMVKEAGTPATLSRSPSPCAVLWRASVRPGSTTAWKGAPMMLTPPSCTCVWLGLGVRG